MKSVSIALIVTVWFILSCCVCMAEQTSVDTGKDAYIVKLEERYRKAVALKEYGDYEGAMAVLQKLVEENQGAAKYEIARLDVILEQSRDMKETGNTAWKSKAREAGFRIKTMLAANAGNSDYWVIYAKYSWLIEANKETHITKALKKAFYYKPNSTEAYIVQADYNFDKAREARSDNSQNSMRQGIGTNTESDRYNIGKIARSSYEAALMGKLSDARKSYVYYKMGELEEHIFQDAAPARKNWEAAVKLSPDSRSGNLAKQRLGI